MALEDKAKVRKRMLTESANQTPRKPSAVQNSFSCRTAGDMEVNLPQRMRTCRRFLLYLMQWTTGIDVETKGVGLDDVS